MNHTCDSVLRKCTKTNQPVRKENRDTITVVYVMAEKQSNESEIRERNRQEKELNHECARKILETGKAIEN